MVHLIEQVNLKLLKAPSRTEKRKLGRSLIATDTPEKNAIAELKSAKRKNQIKRKKSVRQVLQTDSEDDDEETILRSRPHYG